MPNLIVYDAPNLKEHRCCINIILNHRLSDPRMDAQHIPSQSSLNKSSSLDLSGCPCSAVQLQRKSFVYKHSFCYEVIWFQGLRFADHNPALWCSSFVFSTWSLVRFNPHSLRPTPLLLEVEQRLSKFLAWVMRVTFLCNQQNVCVVLLVCFQDLYLLFSLGNRQLLAAQCTDENTH